MATSESRPSATESEVALRCTGGELHASLAMPERPVGLVLFAHGSGSGRFSPRNRQVAAALQDAGFATLLLDLLTPDEERVDLRTRQHRFDIDMLTQRFEEATDWCARQQSLQGLPIGYFGASTGSAVALRAAADRFELVRALVSRGGRPDLAGDALPAALCPTLLVVGGDDGVVVDLNRQALARLGAPVKELVVVPGAGHLFEEPGKLDEVARLAADWFVRHLGTGAGTYSG
jgi:pimeloyl-ACP methyl ester carboxylesterase